MKSLRNMTIGRLPVTSPADLVDEFLAALFSLSGLRSLRWIGWIGSVGKMIPIYCERLGIAFSTT